jgi:hypothetical protein
MFPKLCILNIPWSWFSRMWFVYRCTTKIELEYCLPTSAQCVQYHAFRNVLCNIWTLSIRV